MSEQTKSDLPEASSPAIASQPTGDQPAGAEPSTEESIVNVDALLAAEDPTFAEKMHELSLIQPPPGVVIESSVTELDAIDAEEDASDQEVLEEGPLTLKKRIKVFRQKMRRWSKQPASWLAEFRQGGLAFLIKALKGLVGIVKNNIVPLVGKFFGWLARRIEKAQDYIRYSQRREKLLMMMAFLLTVFIGLVASFALQKRKLMFWEEKEFTAYDSVAEEVWEIKPDEHYYDFYGSWLSPQFYVQFEKMVINLKPTLDSTLPMGAFKFYVEGSTQEAAVELKDREKEIRNIIQLTLREMTFAELETTEGLSRGKASIAAEINKILTQGRVRNVLVDTIVLKP